jgi:hypothetical protein
MRFWVTLRILFNVNLFFVIGTLLKSYDLFIKNVSQILMQLFFSNNKNLILLSFLISRIKAG